MPFKVPVQSTPFSSRRFKSCLLIAATLGLPFGAVAQAQVSVGIGVPLESETAPDPQAITTEELSKLIGGPTLVNFAASNVSAKEAIRALTTTVKGKPFFVNEQDGPLKTISVHWKDKPFWEAADQVEELADGRFLDSFGGPPSFWPYNRGRNQEIEPGLNGLLGAETPLVKLVASTLNRTSTSKILLRETEGAGAATTDEIELVMNAYLDPKLDVRSVQVRQLKFQSKPNTPVVDSSRSVKE
jgi:hypothetical protein